MTVTEFDYDILAKRFSRACFSYKGINLFFRDEKASG